MQRRTRLATSVPAPAVGRAPAPVRAAVAPLAGLAVVLAVATVLGLVAAQPASAHTDLLQGSPAPGQNVGGRIDFIDLVFTEPVSEAVITVTFDGEVLSGTMAATEGPIIRLDLDEPLSDPGRYEVRYEMISFDLDDTVETFFFTYDPAAPEPPRLGVVVESSGTNWAAIIASAVLLAALAGLLYLFVKRLEAQRDEAEPKPNAR